MAELNSSTFTKCTLQQYKHGALREIAEIISPEVPCHFTYTCRDTSQGQELVFTGEKTLYAYPVELEKLVLGHTVLDVLPCYNADFTQQIHNTDNTFKVILEAIPKQGECAPIQKLSFAQVLETMTTMLETEGLWDGTGCFHRAALYHPEKQELILAEDIGRHNCVDRLKGHTLLHNLPIEEYFLFITARITTSLYHKIRRAGIKHMVSRSAITSTPFESARNEGCTLAAFCRPEDKRVTLFAGDAIY